MAEVTLTTARRVKEETLLNLLAAGGLELTEAEKGYGASLQKGDLVTFGDLYGNTMQKAFVGAEGTLNPVYWTSECSIKRGTITFKGDVADAVFTRSGKQHPSLEDTVTTGGRKTANLGGIELYYHLMEELKLSKKQIEFNLNLSAKQTSRGRLRSLKGKTLRVIGAIKAYTRKFNSKGEEDWGSKPSHWASTTILFFEEA